MTKLFIAYPSAPSSPGETIERAKEEAKTSAPRLYITTWRRDDLGGQNLIVPIIEALTASDIVVTDITVLNFNVVYELGYAIGLGKRVLPVVNKSIKYDEEAIAQIGIFDTLLYEPYSTANDLLSLLSVAQPGRRIATEYPIDPLPLYVVLPPVMTDDTNQILVRTRKAGLRSRKFDPLETGRLTIDTVRSVAISNGIVLPLLAPEMKDALAHNMRVAFVAGVAHALDKETLILQKGFWRTPLDIRDEVLSYSTDQQLITAIADFASKVHDARFSSPLPTPGPANKLASLNLGDPAAEGEESTLSNYFLELDDFRQVLEGRANIAVGRKGSGKTAVFFQVRDRLNAARANVILALNPEAYQLGKLKDLVLRCLAAGSKQFLLSAFWEYVLLLEICQRMIEKDRDVHKRNHKLYEPYQRLLTYYRAETSTVGISFSDRLIRLIDRVAKNYASVFGDKKDVTLENGHLTNILYQTTLHELRIQVIEYAKNKGKVYLLFDNIDKGWNASGLEDSDVVMIRTLLDASRKLVNDFRRSETDFYSVVFLRNDIYDVLISQTPDRGKETTAVLDWKRLDLLKQLVRKRLLYNSSEKTLSVDQLWHNICVPLVEGEDSLSYLLSRSMMRPRYVLQLINFCKGNAINFNRDRMDETDIEEGLSSFSSYVLKEIGLEIRDVLRGAGDVLYVFLGEPREMKRLTVESLIRKIAKSDDDFNAIFALLLWHGVLGLRRNRDEVTYIYDLNYDLRRLTGLMDKLGAENVTLQINSALWPGLEMT
jgi:hypothetical protein